MEIDDVKTEEYTSSRTFFAKFHIFDVGQGNSQFIYYPEQNIGFLYDAGSASKNKHVKFLDKKIRKPFLRFKNEKDLFGSDEEDERDELKINVEEKIGRKKSAESKESTTSNDRKDAINIPDIRQSIRDVIKNSGINLLFVFLSHPDKDHLNFLSDSKDEPDIIPNGLKTMFFACGQFIHNESEDVKRFLSYFKNKNNTFAFFPYTWGRNTKEDFLMSIEKKPYEDLIQRGFYDFLDIDCKNNDDKKLGFLKGDQARIKELRDKVFIWGINFRSNDLNAQSAIMSFKLDENSSLIVTGDAEPSTFDAVINKATNNNIDSNKILGKDRLLVIPHHGAEDNISKSMIEYFNPSLPIISAANGIQFGHPHSKLIKWLLVHMENQKNESFEFLGGSSNMIVYHGKYDDNDWYKKVSKTTNATSTNSHSTLRKTGKIVSTNVSGNIDFSDGIFYHTFSNLLEYTQGNFLVNFEKSVKIHSFSEPDIQKAINTNGGLLIDKEMKYFFAIQYQSDKVNSGVKLYSLEKLEG